MRKFVHFKNDSYLEFDFGYSPYWTLIPTMHAHIHTKKSFGFSISWLWFDIVYSKGAPF